MRAARRPRTVARQRRARAAAAAAGASDRDLVNSGEASKTSQFSEALQRILSTKPAEFEAQLQGAPARFSAALRAHGAASVSQQVDSGADSAASASQDAKTAPERSSTESAACPPFGYYFTSPWSTPLRPYLSRPARQRMLIRTDASDDQAVMGVHGDVIHVPFSEAEIATLHRAVQALLQLGVDPLDSQHMDTVARRLPGRCIIDCKRFFVDHYGCRPAKVMRQQLMTCPSSDTPESLWSRSRLVSAWADTSFIGAHGYELVEAPVSAQQDVHNAGIMRFVSAEHVDPPATSDQGTDTSGAVQFRWRMQMSRKVPVNIVPTVAGRARSGSFVRAVRPRGSCELAPITGVPAVVDGRHLIRRALFQRLVDPVAAAPFIEPITQSAVADVKFGQGRLHRKVCIPPIAMMLSLVHVVDIISGLPLAPAGASQHRGARCCRQHFAWRMCLRREQPSGR